MAKKPTPPLMPVKFPEANRNLLSPDGLSADECSALWVYTDGSQCISCWKLNLWQRLAILFHGKVWLSVLSGQSQPPVWLCCGRTVFVTEEKHE